MCLLSDLVVDIEAYITGTPKDSNIIKRHSRKLEILGDLSFPASVNSWKRVFDCDSNQFDDVLIRAQQVRLPNEGGDESPLTTLVKTSEKWALKISKCVLIKKHYHVFVLRNEAFKNCIEHVLQRNENFGAENKLFCNIKLAIDNENKDNKFGESLSEMRVLYLKSVTQNLLNFATESNNSQMEQVIEFSLKSGQVTSNNNKVIYCGPVLNETGVKNTATSEKYLKKRTVDMRLMAEHKYGIRATSHEGWKEIWNNLGKSSVIIELLQNTPSHSTVVSLSNSSIASVKGAPFIMYNGARLTKLIKEFDTKVTKKSYPELPDLKDINFDLLNQPEEWELLYVYILQFPQNIYSCIGDIQNGRINTHILIKMLSNMANVFSVYYRRVKILTEPQQHLFPILHARIYLLKCLLQVFYNSMALLNIKPVTQM